MDLDVEEANFGPNWLNLAFSRNLIPLWALVIVPLDLLIKLRPLVIISSEYFI